MISKLLNQYKNMINHNDKMQKGNLKFVEGYIRFQKRKNHDKWEQDCIDFLNGAIDLQHRLIENINKARLIK